MFKAFAAQAFFALFTAMFAGGHAAPVQRGGLKNVPSYSHVIVVLVENEDEAATWSSSGPAHYLNSLKSDGVFLPNYYGTGHASLDNYIALTSGEPDQPLTGTDCDLGQTGMYPCIQSVSNPAYAGGRNIGDQFDDAHLSWKGYMDSMPSPCFHGDTSPTATSDPYQGDSRALPATDYADRHNPYIWYQDIVGNSARCQAHDVPYTQMATDLKHNTVPAFSFITPDTCHDGHDNPCSSGQPGGLVSADLWFSQNIPALIKYVDHNNGLLIITSDESGVDQSQLTNVGCCEGGPAGATMGIGGQIGLLAIAPHLKGGSQVQTKYDHMSLLRTIEDIFGISEHLNNAASSPAMADMFVRG